jgi:Arc/MetJ-type ribon-helix-helix transcriptional regulator
MYSCFYRKRSSEVVGVPRTKAQEKMVLLSVHLPKQLLEELDRLVAEGVFPSRSEAIRTAVWELVRREKQQREGEDTQIMTGR